MYARTKKSSICKIQKLADLILKLVSQSIIKLNMKRRFQRPTIPWHTDSQISLKDLFVAQKLSELFLEKAVKELNHALNKNLVRVSMVQTWFGHFSNRFFCRNRSENKLKA